MKKLQKIALTTIVALVAINGTITASAGILGQIMPLGDSITAGYPDGGYRAPLYQKLTDANYQFLFVGSETNYYSSAMANAGQTHHEGHGGYRIFGDGTAPGLGENLGVWLGSNGASPDIILLMAGTNEMGSAAEAAAAPGHLDQLINNIYYYQPEVELYVASLTFRTSYQDYVEAFNAEVPGIVSNYQSSGKEIHFVDMYPVLTASDLADGVHPNAIGYEKLATAWYNAIVVPEPGSAILLIMGAITGVCLGRNRRR